MSDSHPTDLPPAPLSLEGNYAGFVYIADADGRKVATMLGPEPRKLALASWIVDTYNSTHQTKETSDG